MESDYKFIKEPDDVLKCCICLEIARNPKQEEACGKLFCSDCIEEWDEACPHCRAEDPWYLEEHEGSTEHHFPIAMKKITELNIIMSSGASTSWNTDNTGPRIIFKLSEYTEKKEK